MTQKELLGRRLSLKVKESMLVQDEIRFIQDVIASIPGEPAGQITTDACRGCSNMGGLACEICLLNGGKRPDSPHEPTPQEREEFFKSEIDETTCKKCGGEMIPGQALINTPFGYQTLRGPME